MNIPKVHFVKFRKQTKPFEMKHASTFLLMITIVVSCHGQINKVEKETSKILNVVLSIYDEPICMDKATFFDHRNIDPAYMINHCFRVYNSYILNAHDSIKDKNVAYQVFYKGVDGVISKNELTELKEINLQWTKKEWEESEIVNRKDVSIGSSDFGAKCEGIRLLRVSEPIFTPDGNKAIILLKTTKNNSGSTFMKILKEENGHWVVKGGIPIGTIG